jgi:type IV secretory pathway VirB10-like protein
LSCATLYVSAFSNII